MGLTRCAFLIGCLTLMTGCGSLIVFETEQQRQAQVDAAVHRALERERGKQDGGALVSLPGTRQASDSRLDGLERMTLAIANRLDTIERAGGHTGPSADGTLYGNADAPALTSEIDSLQRDVAALTEAVSRLTGGDSDSEAVLRARLERLELRTSRIAWPTPSSAVRAVHLASYRTHQAALAGWEVLMNRYRYALEDEIPTLIEVRTVAGEYVRLFAGAGRSQEELLEIREALRDGGDYAMIMPLPGNAGS